MDIRLNLFCLVAWKYLNLVKIVVVILLVMNIHTISSEKINFIIFDAHARVYSVRNKVLVMASAMYPSFYLQLIKVKIIINLLSFSIEPSIKYQIVFVLNIHVEHFSALSLLWHCSLLL